MIAFFEIIGGFVRYLVVNAYYKITSSNKTKKLSFFMEDKRGETFTNVNKDYYNGIVGFITFGALLFLAYLLYN